MPDHSYINTLLKKSRSVLAIAFRTNNGISQPYHGALRRAKALASLYSTPRSKFDFLSSPSAEAEVGPCEELSDCSLSYHELWG